jgi:hypothetical protein
VSKATFQRIMKTYHLATYRDPRDSRVRLLTLEDVEMLRQPVPTPLEPPPTTPGEQGEEPRG